MADETKTDYFIEQTNERLEKIDEKLEELLKFKWQVLGSSVSLSVVITIIFQYFASKGG